ncbi:MAG: hypothetical protein D4R65_07125 [Verrucomicrobiaceae bacterium]|nr:MAG: hypothetical protein D4R65_07125 [Verrucomicrobiaceae bacterium]
MIDPEKKPNEAAAPSGSREPAKPDELPSYFEEPEPEPAWKRFVRGRAFRAGVVVVLLAGAVVVAGPRLYREIKARRALSILAAAEEAMRLGDVAVAREKVRAAFSLAPSDPRVARTLTRYRAEAGEREAYQTLAGWVAEGSATPAEQLAFAGIAIKRKDAAAARKSLDALPSNLPPDLETGRILALANLLANEGRLTEAARMLRDARVPDDQMRRIRLVLGTLLLTTSPATEEEGRNILHELGKSDSGEGLAALRQLAARHLGTSSAGEWAESDRLISHPQHTFSDILLCNQIRIAQSGSDRGKLIGDLIAAAGKRDIKDRCALAQWLLAMQSPDRVEEVFSRDDLTTSEPALLAVADALAAQGRWKDIRALLTGEKRPQLDEALRQLFLAKVAQQLGEEENTDMHWQAVRRELAFSPVPTIRQAAAYALNVGRGDSARQALELLVESKEAAPGDFAELVRMIPPAASAEEVLSVLDKFHAAYPQIPEVRSDIAYLSLLTGRDPEASYATARELFARYPDYLSYLSVLALAEILRGHPEEAARLYDGREIAWNDALPQFKLVRIAVLKANGRSKEAEALRATLNPAMLRPEELELLEKADSASSSTPQVPATLK